MFALFVCFGTFCFDVCHCSLPIHTFSHIFAHARTCFAFASKWWWDSLHQNMCRYCYYSLCSVCDCFVFLKLPKPLLLCHASRWIGILFFCMSLSLTKHSMENKCGIYVLQNINKNSQVVPKIFCFCIFGFTSAGCKCVFVFVCFKFASYAFWSVGWVDQILVMQVVRVSTTDFGVMRIFNCAKLCQNMFQLRRTIKDFGKWALNQSVAEGLSYYTVFVFTVLL